jgi:hypothetical protein
MELQLSHVSSSRFGADWRGNRVLQLNLTGARLPLALELLLGEWPGSQSTAVCICCLLNPVLGYRWVGDEFTVKS